MNLSQTQARKVILGAVLEVAQTWTLSPREIQEVLISIAGDIATNEKGFVTTGDDGFMKLGEELEKGA